MARPKSTEKARPRLPFRLIVVSNRGPYHLHRTKTGMRREKTIGGLVTSILPMLEMFGGVWVAWGRPEGRYESAPGQPGFDLRYIHLTAAQEQAYYHGLANSALWPLSHYFLGRVRYDDSQWASYVDVNAQFGNAVLEEAGPGDLVWVHDYHLALVPRFLREKGLSARLAFFWHIPFPAAEVFRTLPWRKALLEGLLSCDLIGFHIPEYAENFIETAVEVLGAQPDGDEISYAGRTTRVLARPIGIDYQAVHREATSPRTEERVQHLRRTLEGQAIIFGVERMDYTKGILERLKAIGYLLEHHPELHGKVTLIQAVTPSRSEVEAYRQQKREIDEVVGRVNGRFSDGFWIPIRYLYRAISPAELISYYRAADIALVTPLRDGLNLVAKEYVASRVNSDGVLILSEFAGVARQLPEALLVNPYSVEEMAGALVQALLMPVEEQRRQMQPMQARIAEQDISWWAKEFLKYFDAF
ncbi:MAG: alpha,alpha-trehalose-phosphate synthase (UDP-forming) [Rudaea sp.]